jgi:hypothetical protein
MIDRSHRLPLTRQARVLGISRGSVFYLPKPLSPADLAIMRRIDELHLEFPFAGSRMLRDPLRQEGIEIGRQHVATLMKKMAIEAIYRRPNTSKPAPGHKIYPYLLRKLAIVRPNQVWATDISYIPMAKGFVYLVAIVDWFSRKVLAWRVSISMEADFCIDALEEALARYGKPEIFNTDQGSQGGLNRSSQHFDRGSCDGHEEAAIGSMWTAAIAVSRAAAGGHTKRAATVLDVHRWRDEQRDSCAQGWIVATCGDQMVPGGGRYATSDVQARGEAAVGKISVIGRARGHCAAARPGS